MENEKIMTLLCSEFDGKVQLPSIDVVDAVVMGPVVSEADEAEQVILEEEDYETNSDKCCCIKHAI